MTLNFIHFTIQEFLAAHYICQLPPNEELEVIKANFWSDTHFNMLSIFTLLTKGQQPAFKNSCQWETKRSPFLQISLKIGYNVYTSITALMRSMTTQYVIV